MVDLLLLVWLCLMVGYLVVLVVCLVGLVFVVLVLLLAMGLDDLIGWVGVVIWCICF